jgi:hypothetical protein
VIFAGYLIFGVTEFGASPSTIPVLVHVPSRVRAVARRASRMVILNIGLRVVAFAVAGFLISGAL